MNDVYKGIHTRITQADVELFWSEGLTLNERMDILAKVHKDKRCKIGSNKLTMCLAYVREHMYYDIALHVDKAI